MKDTLADCQLKPLIISNLTVKPVNSNAGSVWVKCLAGGNINSVPYYPYEKDIEKIYMKNLLMKVAPFAFVWNILT